MINVFYYDKYVKRGHLSSTLLENKHRVWVDLYDPSRDELKHVFNLFNLDNKIIEDYKDKTIRPKIREYKDYTFAMIYSIQLDKNTLNSKEVIFVIGRNYLISIHRDNLQLANSLIHNMERLNYALKSGVDYLFYELTDQVVDSYFPVLETIDDELEDLENNALKNDRTDVLRRLFKIKSQFLRLRNVVYPQREALSLICRNEYKHLSKDVRELFREIDEHMILITDLMEVHRETTSNIMELHLSVTSNKLNENIKVLTIIATMFMPITFIASLYGMNLKLPIDEHRYAFFIIVGIMLIIFCSMLFYFNRKKLI